MELSQDVWYAKTGDGVRIAYQVVGDGPVDLVFQIDSPGNIDFWRTNPLDRPYIEGLATFSRVILHDRRATGLSSRNVPPPNLETRVSDLEVVLDHVGSERPVLFGHVESGAANVLFAATHPERAHSIVWSEAQARSVWMPDYPWGIRPEQVEANARLHELFGTIEYGRVWLDVEASSGNPFSEDWAVQIAMGARNTCTPDVAAEFDRIWYETDVRGVLPAVRVPVLMLVHEGREASVQETRYIASLIPDAEVRPMPGTAWTADEAPAWVDEVRRFVGIEPAPASLDTILSTVLFTDIVGSTEKQASLGDHGWKDLVERHHAMVRHTLSRYRGVENDTAGDGFYATFDGPARAIRAAKEMAEGVHDLGIEIRAGVHTGECELVESKCAGLTVSIGARVASIAGPSEVVVSQTVKDLVAGSGLTFEDAGEHELKGVPDLWRLFRVVG